MLKADMPVYQGDDFSGLVEVTDDATGAPSDLTGYTARSQIRKTVADGAVVAVEIETALVLPNRIVLTIPHTATQALSGNYVWDLQVESPAGIVTTIVAGKVLVTQEVTREVSVTYERSKTQRQIPAGHPA